MTACASSQTSTSRALSLSIAGLLLLGLPLLAAPALAASSKAVVEDPVGDTFGSGPAAIDLRRLEARRDETEVVIELGFAGTISPPDSVQTNAVVGFVDLDVDQNAATGGLPFVDFLTDFESGMGNEFYVPLATYSSEDRRADLVADAGATVVGRVPVTVTSDTLTLRIPHTLLGDDGNLHTAVVVGTAEAAVDAAPNGGFVASGTAGGGEVLLQDERFRVELAWRDFQGNTGSGELVFRSEDSAVFWFFNADNWELLVKVLDGCPVNDRFWVFSAATTNVEYTLTVTDTVSSAVREYVNPLGTAAAAVTDTDAFTGCP